MCGPCISELFKPQFIVLVEYDHLLQVVLSPLQFVEEGEGVEEEEGSTEEEDDDSEHLHTEDIDEPAIVLKSFEKLTMEREGTVEVAEAEDGLTSDPLPGSEPTGTRRVSHLS